MLQTSFLKFYAREELKGEYLRTFLGALAVIIPTYLMSNINTLALQIGIGWYGVSLLLAVLVGIFVTEILNVSFIKSLLRMKPTKESVGDEKRYEPETVLSRFSEGYGTVLKVTFVKDLYLFGWGLLVFIPILLLAGVLAYISNTPEIGELMNLIGQYQLSPTDEMALYIGSYISENCSYVIPLVTGAYILMIALSIPSIYKKYEYIMIPYIVADNTDITVKEAFKKTREIMHGYRKVYFYIELSFIALSLIPVLVMGCTQSVLLTYVATAAITPYMTTTYLQFYKERNIMLKPDVEGENKNEN